MSRGHAVVITSGVALFVTSFVPLWATYRVPGLGLVAPKTVHQNAWTAYGFTMQLALLLALVATGVALVLVARRHASPDRTAVLLALCGAATVLLVWELARGPEGSSRPSGYGIDRGVLAFTGAALAACMTYGSHLVWRAGRERQTGPSTTGRG